MKRIAVFMAGGNGERLRAMVGGALPKQFLDLLGVGKTMLQISAARLQMADIFVVTGKDGADFVREQLPFLPFENVLIEPQRRNTAPCIALAAEFLRKKFGDAVMMVIPTDHFVAEEKLYRADLERAASFAEAHDALVTLGVVPTSPETGYGYLKLGAAAEGLHKVERFAEKPEKSVAESYLKDGNYLWNAGIFVWKISAIQAALARYLPGKFMELPKISIDKGIMERAENVYTLPASFTWADIGNPNTLQRIRSYVTP
ncbi:mannose-1-phosphate guanylyltransferase [Clostridia bacterium]|nr:mannose-1-phosphate guanylyltransferase [Clostridia bacterium]